MLFDDITKLRHRHIPHPTKYYCINRRGGKRKVRVKLRRERFGGLELNEMLHALKEGLSAIICEELVLWQGAK